MTAPRDAREETAAPWWPVSTAKLVVMTLGTLGIYHYYWIYGNWQRMRARESAAISPAWRTVFAPFTLYRMFERAHADAATAEVRTHWSAIGLAAAYLIANIALLFGIPTWLMGPVLLLPVLPVAMTMTAVNEKVAPDAPRNARLTAMNWMFLAMGAAATALVYVEARLVDQLLQEWTP